MRLHDATTSTADLYIPPSRPGMTGDYGLLVSDCWHVVRPETRDTGTTTAGLPRRPLCATGRRPSLSVSIHPPYHLETQIIERYEKNEKVRRDSTSSTGETPPIQRLRHSFSVVFF